MLDIVWEEKLATGGKKAAPRRRPISGGYPRGEEQRRRIVTAALKVFADEGYERASTRLIAKEAGVTPPALQYYFDSKEGLNRACAEFVIGQAMNLLATPLKAALEVLPAATPQKAVEILCDVMDALVDASLFKREFPEYARFSARAQAEDSPAGPMLQARISDPIHTLCVQLVARATGAPVNDRIWLRTSIILSQISAFHIHKDGVLKRLGWPDFDNERRAEVKAILRAHTRAVLKAKI